MVRKYFIIAVIAPKALPKLGDNALGRVCLSARKNKVHHHSACSIRAIPFEILRRERMETKKK